MFQIDSIKLSSIRIDSRIQPRTALSLAVVEEYAESMANGDKFPPVTVFDDGGGYWLADGFHRLEATKKINAATILAEIRPGMRRDAILLAVGANAQHGVRRTNADKRKAVLTLLSDSEWSQWSNRRIAQQCGVTEGLVRKLKSELTAYNTHVTPEETREWGVDADTLRKAQQLLAASSQVRLAQRQGVVYRFAPTSSSMKKTKESCHCLEPLVEVLAADDSGSERHLKVVSQLDCDSVASLPGDFDGRACPSPMRILGQSPVVSSTISSQDRAIPECDASHPVRIINIESDTSKSVEGITPTFEIRVKVEGRSEVLTALLKQMQLDTCFAARVFSLAQEFADSHSLER